VAHFLLLLRTDVYSHTLQVESVSVFGVKEWLHLLDISEYASFFSTSRRRQSQHSKIVYFHPVAILDCWHIFKGALFGGTTSITTYVGITPWSSANFSFTVAWHEAWSQGCSVHAANFYLNETKRSFAQVYYTFRQVIRLQSKSGFVLHDLHYWKTFVIC
jgi:hypothetical protein